MGVNGIYGLSGSGLDVESMVKVGMLSKQAEYDKMQQKYTQNEWKKTEFLDLYGEVQTFNNSTLSQYKMSGNMNARAASSNDTSAVSATANANAPIMSHYVEVGQLATAAYLIGNNHVKADGQESIELLDKIFGEGLWKYDAATGNILGGNVVGSDGTLKNIVDGVEQPLTVLISDTSQTAFSFVLSDGTVDPNLKTNNIQSSNERVVKIKNLDEDNENLKVDTHTIKISATAKAPTIRLGVENSSLTSSSTMAEWFFGAVETGGLDSTTFNASLLEKYVEQLKVAKNDSDFGTRTALSFSFSLSDTVITGANSTKVLNFSYNDLLDTGSFTDTFQTKLNTAYGNGRVKVGVENGQLTFTASDTGNITSMTLTMDATTFEIGSTGYELKSYPDAMTSTKLTGVTSDTNALDVFSKILNGSTNSANTKSKITTIVNQRSGNSLNDPAISFTIQSSATDSAKIKTVSFSYAELSNTHNADSTFIKLLQNKLDTENTALSATLSDDGVLYISNGFSGSDSRISFTVNASSDFGIADNANDTAPASWTSKVISTSQPISGNDTVGNLLAKAFGLTVAEYNSYMPTFASNSNKNETAFSFRLNDGHRYKDIEFSFNDLTDTSMTIATFVDKVNEKLHSGTASNINFVFKEGTNATVGFENNQTGSSNRIQFSMNTVNLGGTGYEIGTLPDALSTTTNAKVSSGGSVKNLFKDLLGNLDNSLDYDKAMSRFASSTSPAITLKFTNPTTNTDGTLTNTTPAYVTFSYKELIDANSPTLKSKFDALKTIGINVGYDNNQLTFSSTKVGSTLSYQITGFNLGSGTDKTLATTPDAIKTATQNGLNNGTRIIDWFSKISGINNTDTLKTYISNVTDTTQIAFSLVLNDGKTGTDTTKIDFTYDNLSSTNLLSSMFTANKIGNISVTFSDSQLIFSNANTTYEDKVSYSIQYSSNWKNDLYTLGTKSTSQGSKGVFKEEIFNSTIGGTSDTSFLGQAVVSWELVESTSTTTNSSVQGATEYTDGSGNPLYQYVANGKTFQTTQSALTRTAYMTTDKVQETLANGDTVWEVTVDGIDGTTYYLPDEDSVGTEVWTTTTVSKKDPDTGKELYGYHLIGQTAPIDTTDPTVLSGTKLWKVVFDTHESYTTESTSSLTMSTTTTAGTDETKTEKVNDYYYTDTITTYTYKVGSDEYTTVGTVRTYLNTDSSTHTSTITTAASFSHSPSEYYRYTYNNTYYDKNTAATITPTLQTETATVQATDTTTGQKLWTFKKAGGGTQQIADSDGSIHAVAHYVDTTTQVTSGGHQVWQYEDGDGNYFTTTSNTFTTTKLYKVTENVLQPVTESKYTYLQNNSSTREAFSFVLSDGKSSGTRVTVGYSDLLTFSAFNNLSNTIKTSLNGTNIEASVASDGKLVLTNKKVGGSEGDNKLLVDVDYTRVTNGLTENELEIVTQALFGVAISGDSTVSIDTGNKTEISTSTLQTNLNNFFIPSNTGSANPNITYSTDATTGNLTVASGNTGYTSAVTKDTLQAKVEQFFNIPLQSDGSVGGTNISNVGEIKTNLSNTQIRNNIGNFFTNSSSTSKTTYGTSSFNKTTMAKNLAEYLSADTDSSKWTINNGVYTYTADGGYDGPDNLDIGDALGNYLGLKESPDDSHSFMNSDSVVAGTNAQFFFDGEYKEITTNVYTDTETTYDADGTTILGTSEVQYEFINPGEAFSTYKDAKTISLTYDQLKNGYTFNDLAVDINSLGTNVRASYDSVQDRFSIYNKKSGSANQIRLTMKDQNAADFFESLDLFQSIEGERQPNALDTSDLSKWYANFVVGETSILTGTDAIAKIDGVDYTGLEANSVTVNGVSYTFNSVTHNLTEANEKGEKFVDSSSAKTGMSKVTVNITQDTTKIADNVKSFVEKYNTLINKLYEWYNEKPNSDYKPLTESQKSTMKDEQIEKWEEKAKAGLLYHDRTLGNLITEIRKAVTEKVDGITGQYNNIFALGISTTGLKGQLTIDETKLNEAIAADPDAVYNIFARLDSGEKYYRLYDKTTGKEIWSLTPLGSEDRPSSKYTEVKGSDGKVMTKTKERSSYNGIAQRLGDILTTGLKNIKSVSGSTGEVSEDSELNNLMRELQTKMSNFQTMLKAFESRLYKKYDAMESALALLGAQLNYVTGAFQ